MSEYVPTQGQFMHDLRDHKLFIEYDQGLYRHISAFRMKDGQKSCAFHFHITTWPGYLCITGDMGCLTFSRVEDMFCFFRSDDGKINPWYWMEKLQVCRGSSSDVVMNFSEECFRDGIQERFEDWKEDCELSPGTIAETQEAISEDIFAELENNGEVAAYRAAMDFSTNGLTFPDFWEFDSREFDFHYIWLCRAIVWAIQEYDKQEVKS